jgi:hypothetical protein
LRVTEAGSLSCEPNAVGMSKHHSQDLLRRAI